MRDDSSPKRSRRASPAANLLISHSPFPIPHSPFRTSHVPLPARPPQLRLPLAQQLRRGPGRDGGHGGADRGVGRWRFGPRQSAELGD